MDDLTAPRRSIHPSQLPTRQPREPKDIPLSEYAIAVAIDIPQFGLYTRVSRDLQAWMTRSKEDLESLEDDVAKVSPGLFLEYMRTPDGDRPDFLVSGKRDELHFLFLMIFASSNTLISSGSPPVVKPSLTGMTGGYSGSSPSGM